MTDVDYRKIILDGLWHNNGGLVQALGLCPLLAVTSTAVNGLGLGIATTLTLLCSSVAISLIRDLVRPEVRIPMFVLIIASVVTAIELSMHAWFFELYHILGIFIPLIVTNCIIMGRAEAFASRHDVTSSAVDALAMGLGFTLLLVVLGGLREIIGQGTLFAQAHLMFGEPARALTITVFNEYRGFLFAILPPGAFLGLGLLIALKNVIDERMKRRAGVRPAPAPAAAAAEEGA